ncbi:MAG: hypothetical protein RJQ14_02405 [Marinoscillum sp.]
MNNKNIHIALISPPGDTIQETMEVQGVDIPQLAESLQLDENEIDALIRGEIAIDKILAHRLAESLGIPATFWINREAEYQKELKQHTA